jgi:hypothetical protein
VDDSFAVSVRVVDELEQREGEKGRLGNLLLVNMENDKFRECFAA